MRRLLPWWAVLLGALALPAFAHDTVYYYYTTPLHNVVIETDASGNVVEGPTYYAPYGQVLNRSLRDGPGYTGHEEDPATGLVYMQQRYYDPE
ncbi:MAG: RHS repeat-associated core domain-containing protein, partial [Ktedonobacteraceae bacterium]